MNLNIDGIDVVVRALEFEEIDGNFLGEWKRLERRVRNGNAFLSPNFILPAAKYLTPKKKPLFLAISRSEEGADSIIGIGIFELSRGSMKFPLPFLKAYRTPHSYLGGILTDNRYVSTAVNAIFEYVKRKKNLFGLEYVDHVENGEMAMQMARSGDRYGMGRLIGEKKKRAILIPGKLDERYIDVLFSVKKKKALRRQYNHLSKYGAVHWRIHIGRQIDSGVIDRFLRLENMGWKGDRGSSLLTDSNNELFFREMISNFSKEESAFFTELSVGDRVIASTSNLIASNTGFAFKIGWDIEFAKASPGILNEYEFIKEAARYFSGLDYIDSGAEEGSFIDDLWPERIVLESGIYASKLITGVLNVFKPSR